MKNTEKAMLVVDMPINCMHCYLSVPAKEKAYGTILFEMRKRTHTDELKEEREK